MLFIGGFGVETGVKIGFMITLAKDGISAGRLDV